MPTRSSKRTSTRTKKPKAQKRLRFVCRFAERLPASALGEVPRNTRGIYALLQRRRPRNGKEKYDVVYVGMAGGDKGGIAGRLRTHRRRKSDVWDHFSVFEVWPNITRDEIQELEGILRHIYRKDSRANALNVQKGYGALGKLRRRMTAKEPKDWAPIRP